MTQNSPCGCGDDHEEAVEKEEEHSCCGGGQCHDDQEVDGEEHECCGGVNCGSDKPEEDSCGCGHDHGHDHAPATPEEIAQLMKAIEDAGYKVEENENGEVRILEK